MELNNPFNVKNNELFIDYYKIYDLVNKYNAPLILYSAEIIKNDYNNLYKNLSIKTQYNIYVKYW